MNPTVINNNNNNNSNNSEPNAIPNRDTTADPNNNANQRNFEPTRGFQSPFSVSVLFFYFSLQ